VNVAAGLITLIGSLTIPLAAVQSPVPPRARGEEIYARSCASCHGPAGEGGKGPALSVPQLFRAPDREALVAIIRRGIEGTEMPGTRLLEADASALADWVLRLGQRPLEKLPGDPRRGAQLYSQKGGCASCHAIQGRGGTFGPDLADIGRRRGAAHLRQSLLEPDADMVRSSSIYRANVSITENFLFVRVTRRDGGALQGVRVNEDTFSIQLRDASGTLHSLRKADLAEVQKDWGRSPMPPYGVVLSAQEIDDVVAYMLSLR
jgi:cytochrome c oxidase cbb3-type subunit III